MKKKNFAVNYKMITLIAVLVIVATGFALLSGNAKIFTGSLVGDADVRLAPTPIAIINQSLPRTFANSLILEWQPLAWANQYQYEMERFEENKQAWDPLPAIVFSSSTPHSATQIGIDRSSTSGIPNLGYFRWRVWGLSAPKKVWGVGLPALPGAKSKWSYFSIGRVGTTPPGFVEPVAPTCTDSDSQYGAHAKDHRGTVQWLHDGSPETHEDRCIDITHLEEQVCSQGRWSIETTPCDRCLDGQCVLLPDIAGPTVDHLCVDSDSQYARPLNHKGVVRWLNEGNLRVFEDHCIDATHLEEQKCIAIPGGLRWSTDTMPCNRCLDGECVPLPYQEQPTPDSRCVDPDGEYGITYQFPFKTTVLWLDGNEVRRYEDRCLDNRRISEQTCYQGRASQETFNCRDSCLDGRCVQSAGR